MAQNISKSYRILDTVSISILPMAGKWLMIPSTLLTKYWTLREVIKKKMTFLVVFYY